MLSAAARLKATAQGEREFTRYITRSAFRRRRRDALPEKRGVDPAPNATKRPRRAGYVLRDSRFAPLFDVE